MKPVELELYNILKLPVNYADKIPLLLEFENKYFNGNGKKFVKTDWIRVLKYCKLEGEAYILNFSTRYTDKYIAKYRKKEIKNILRCIQEH